MLPVDVETPSAFETAGHVAHLNLRESQLPYKAAIGAVIDKVVANISATEEEKALMTEANYRLMLADRAESAEGSRALRAPPAASQPRPRERTSDRPLPRAQGRERGEGRARRRPPQPRAW